ncbi:MAG: fibronectin type III domain-containing protein [Ruminococcus sp.]|nr:fibronectin type III domain-containing protein [Ruminococcus sp.]
MKKTILIIPFIVSVILASCGNTSANSSTQGAAVEMSAEETQPETKRAVASVTPAQEAYTYTGEEITPPITVRDDLGNEITGENYTVQYSNNIETGTAEIKVTGMNGAEGQAAASFEITPAAIEPEIVCEDITYIGQETVPEITVKYGSITLEEGIDYVVSVNGTEAGEASALVALMGNYEGEFEVDYNIVPVALNDESCELSIEDTLFEYTGSPVEPKVTLTCGETELTAGTDFVTEYSNNTDPGRASVTAKGVGNYSGSFTAEFVIKPAKVTGVSAKNTTDSAALSWSRSINAESYGVYQKKSGSWERIAETKETSLNIEKLSPNTYYEFYVTAIMGEYESPESNVIKAGTAANAPAKVIAGNASSTETSATLSWSAAAGAAGYQIYKWNGSEYKYVSNAANGAMSYTVYSLSSDTTYYFKIMAYIVGADGNTVWGEASDMITVKTQPPKAPEAPASTEAEAGEATASETKQKETPEADTSTHLYYFSTNSYLYNKKMERIYTAYAGSWYTGHFDPAYPDYICIDYMNSTYLVNKASVTARANAKMLPTASIGQFGGNVSGASACGPAAATILCNWQVGAGWNKDNLITYTVNHWLCDQGDVRYRGGGMTAPKLITLINGYSGGKYTARNLYGTGINTQVLKDQIDKGNRCLVVVRYKSFGNIVASYSGGTHFVVVCGYEYINGTLYFYYADPFYGSFGSQYSSTLCRVSGYTLSTAMEYSRSKEPACIITVQ